MARPRKRIRHKTRNISLDQAKGRACDALAPLLKAPPLVHPAESMGELKLSAQIISGYRAGLYLMMSGRGATMPKAKYDRLIKDHPLALSHAYCLEAWLNLALEAYSHDKPIERWAVAMIEFINQDLAATAARRDKGFSKKSYTGHLTELGRELAAGANPIDSGIPMLYKIVERAIKARAAVTGRKNAQALATQQRVDGAFKLWRAGVKAAKEAIPEIDNDFVLPDGRWVKTEGRRLSPMKLKSVPFVRLNWEVKN